MSYIRKITRAGQLTEEYKKYVEQQKRKIKKVEALKKDAEDKKHAELMEEMKEEAKQKRVQDRKNQKIRQQLGLKYNMTSTSQDIDDELKRLIEESPDKVLQAYESGNDELLLKKLTKMRIDRMDADARAIYNADKETNEAIMMKENQMFLKDAFKKIRKEVKRMRKAIEKQKAEEEIDPDAAEPKYDLEPRDLLEPITKPIVDDEDEEHEEDEEDEEDEDDAYKGSVQEGIDKLKESGDKEDLKKYLTHHLDDYKDIAANISYNKDDVMIQKILELTTQDYQDIREGAIELKKERDKKKNIKKTGVYKSLYRNNLIPERVLREHLKRMEKKEKKEKVGDGMIGGKQVMRNRIFDKIDNLYAAGLINKTQHKQMASQLI